MRLDWTALADRLESWMQRARARPGWCVGILVALLAAQVGPWWLPTNDACSYLSIARSFAHGQGPTNLGSAHLWYPPGYPALISPLFLTGDRPLWLLSLSQFLLMLALLAGVYRWVRRAAPDAAFWITGVTMVNSGLWLHYRRTLSEVAFACALVWLADVLYRARQAVGGATFLGWSLAAGLLAAVLCLIRPAGATFGPAIAAALAVAAWRRQISWPRAALLTSLVGFGMVGAVGGFLAHEWATATAVQGETYLNAFARSAQDYGASYPQGLQMVISEIGRVTLPGMLKCCGKPGVWRDANMLVYTPLFALLALGWWRWSRRQADFLAWLLPFYVLMLVVYAMDSGGRFFVPLVPVLLVCGWFALEALGRRRLAILGLLLPLHLAAAEVYWLAVDLPAARALARQWTYVDELADAIHAVPGPAAAQSMEWNVRLMLQLAADRPIAVRERLPAEAPVHWLIEPAAARPTPGLICTTAGRYRLVELETATAQRLATGSKAGERASSPSSLNKGMYR